MFYIRFQILISLTLFTDIDECSTKTISANYSHLTHNCHADANCTNNKGTFCCTCHTGYSGDGVTCEGRSDACSRCMCNSNCLDMVRKSVSICMRVETHHTWEANACLEAPDLLRFNTKACHSTYILRDICNICKP